MADPTYRPLRPSDLPELTAMTSHWAVVRQLGGWPWPPDPAFTKQRCKPYTGDGFVWAICLQDRLVGTIGVTGGDLGYMLDPAAQGRGIATLAATAAITHVFATQERALLTGSTWWDNPASARVLEKLGFVHWQTHYIRSLARGLPTLVHQHRLTRAHWDSLSRPAD